MIYLTNIGEHAEATALFDDLNARRLKGIYKHGVIRREAWRPEQGGWKQYKTRKGKAGGVCVAIDLPTITTHKIL